jgi:hypothetical protein
MARVALLSRAGPAALCVCAASLSLVHAGNAAFAGSAEESLSGVPQLEATFKKNQVLVQFTPDLSEAISDLDPDEDHRTRMARVPALAALQQAVRVKRVLPVSKAGRRIGRRSAGPGRASNWREHFFLMEFEGQQDVLEVLQLYEAHPDVVRAQLNYVYSPDAVPNDPLYPQQYAHQRTDVEAGWFAPGDAPD